MSAFREVRSEEMDAAVAEACRPRLSEILSATKGMHRLRVVDLPTSIMHLLCASLDDDRWVARLLCSGRPAQAYEATATKIIELRNTLERPLVVFLPTGLRIAAEDSLDAATFQQIDLGPTVEGASRSLANELLDGHPDDVVRSVEDFRRELRKGKVLRDDDAWLRFLLTWKVNGGTLEAAGRAIFVLGLIPDPQLFQRGSQLVRWLTRNIQIAAALTDARRPLQERIGQIKLEPGTLQRRLFEYFRRWYVVGRSGWTAAVALEPAWRDLEFDRWPFDDAGDTQQVRLILDDLQLPRQLEDKDIGSEPLKVWTLSQGKDLQVSFRAAPKPAEVPAWKNYRIQILGPAQEPGEDAHLLWESPNYPKPKVTPKISRKVKASAIQDHLPDGDYFVRVEAFDADGAVLTKNSGGEARAGRPENESERFLILAETDGAVEAPKDLRAVFAASLLDVWFELRQAVLLGAGRQRDEKPGHQQLTGHWDASANAALKDEVRFEVQGEGVQARTIRVPGVLRALEYAALRSPEHLEGWRLNLANIRTRADIKIEAGEGAPPDDERFLPFIEARGRVFKAILEQHRLRRADLDADKTVGVVEVADLLDLADVITQYVLAWSALCQAALDEKRMAERGRLLGVLAGLDRVDLRWRKTPTDPGRGALLMPVHPLRLAWHLQHVRLRDRLVSSIERGEMDVPDRRAFFQTLNEGLAPTHFPLGLFNRDGRPLIEQDLLTPFWALYLPADSGARYFDVNAVRDEVRGLLGIRRGKGGLGEIPASVLAERVFEYLRRHPYVEQLSINVFNPGEATRVADMLRAVESLRRKVAPEAPPELRYAVRLISGRENAERAGEAVDALLDPERQVAEDDEFTLGSGSYLRPKLLITRVTREDFEGKPEDFRAHLSLLIEQFPVVGRLEDLSSFQRGSFIGGLVLESETRLETGPGSYGWIRAARPVASNDLDDGARLLVESIGLMHRLQAGVAGGTGAENQAPVVALHLNAPAQALLRSVHDVSDQVLIIDRNLGLDFFDSALPGGMEIGYLLDFTPAFLQGGGERLLVTTRCDDELARLIVPALESFGLVPPEGKEAAVVETLRSVSGRIALRMMRGRTAAHETVGLLLARWLLEQSGLLSDRILLPVDAHQDWFAGEGSHQRADLMLVGIDIPTRTLHITMVEVKARTELGSSRSQLYRDMRAQAENTRSRLLDRFDLSRRERADALFRTKELFSLVTFYLDRAVRYRLVAPDRAAQLRTFLTTLDEQAYRLEIHLRGIVYAGDAQGNHLDEDEPDFPVHRFGRDMAQRMVDVALADTLSGKDPIRDGSVRPLPDAMIESIRSFFEAPRLGPDHIGEPSGLVVLHSETDEEVQPAEVAPTAPKQPAVFVEAPNPSAQGPVATPTRVDVLLGATEPTPQFGVLGHAGKAKVGIDLTGCNTISLFGVQGFGKSYTLGVIAEMGAQAMPGINQLPAPLATVVFHYHRSDAYEPEYASATAPNDKAREVDRLLADFQARPEGLRDLVLLVPEAKLEQRKRQYPGLAVHPIYFSSNEIGADGWKFLMGAVGNSSLYVRQIVDIMQSYGGELRLADLEREVAEADFSKSDLRLANNRIRLAKRFVRDGARLRDLLQPGRTIIVDMRDEWLEKEQALGLFLVLMHTFAQAEVNGRLFNKLMVFDEAHKYIGESELIGEVVSMIREMRHWATSVVIASQDPLSVPSAVLALTSLLVLHRITAPEWIKHLKKALVSLNDVDDSVLANLARGEALVWARMATDNRFTLRPQKIVVRPRVTRHGGGTRTAVDGATVR